MPELATMKCTACRGDEPPLSDDEIESMRSQTAEWDLVERGGAKRLRRSFRFKDFARALAFTQRVGGIAEEQGHHPRIVTEWGRVTVDWYTHKIKGLHLNDFVMAARTDRLAQDT
jgi:4a-hydroxytetrahydrobiopterin dehydratase